MSRSSGELTPGAGDRRRPAAPRLRGQASPVAALVALLAVIAGVGLYAAVVGDVDRSHLHRDGDRTAATAADALLSAAADGDVVVPGRLRDATADPDVMPTGFHTNVTLVISGNDRWHAGPSLPAHSGGYSGDGSADGTAVQRADRTLAVRRSPGEIRSATLRVRVWQ